MMTAQAKLPNTNPTCATETPALPSRALGAVSSIEVGSLSRQRPRHPLRLSQYELSALLHALPDAMGAGFVAAYDVPQAAQPLVCKRTQGAPWTSAQMSRVQFFVKWCLTTIPGVDSACGQAALHHYLAVCIEAAFDVTCTRRPPYAQTVLAREARIKEAEQRGIVKAVRAICEEQAPASPKATPLASASPAQPTEPVGSPQPLATLPPLPDQFFQPLALPAILSVRSEACLTRLQHALAAPVGASALAGHVRTHAMLQEAVSQLKDDFDVWFEGRDAEVMTRHAALRAQESALVQLEQSLQEASDHLIYGLHQCSDARDELDRIRTSLGG